MINGVTRSWLRAKLRQSTSSCEASHQIVQVSDVPIQVRIILLYMYQTCLHRQKHLTQQRVVPKV